MLKLSLNGKWQFKDSEGQNFLPANVPGCQYLDLLNLKIIEDPFVELNEEKSFWVGEKDWIYKKEFDVTDDIFNSKSIILEFNRIDTIADVTFNGVLLAKTDNINRVYDFDIKPYIKKDNNILIIYFHSPVNYVKEAYSKDKNVANTNGIKGVPHIRKAQCHFGWDWGPCLPTVGLGGDVTLYAFDITRIENIQIIQRHFDNKVELEITADAEEGKELEFVLSNPNKQEFTVTTKNSKATFLIENPQLWWTNDISGKIKQPLYSVNVLYKGDPTSKVTKRIGLRTIILNKESDEYGKQFQFVLNGVPLFCKGANFIPADSFYTRFDETKINKLLNSALDANMNMIRVWGGGFYESDAFYDKCDELGILIWQDFCFACGLYPLYNEEFLSNVKKEVIDNVKRLRHHPSLALWCGNNEIEAMSALWRHKKKALAETKKFFYHILPELLSTLDNVTPFIQGSPTSYEFLKNVNSPNEGDSHLWNVWHGLQPITFYRKKFSRFCSEFGMESLPDIKTLLSFTDRKNFSMTSPAFKSHQKCLSGNEKILYYIALRFRLPKNFEDMAYLSQIMQAEVIKDATEHWRRNRGRCNGSLYWQLNDCWPCMSWAGMDYYGRYKALHYRAKHFFSPICVSLVSEGKNKVDLYVINDTTKPVELSARLTLNTFDGKELIFDDFVFNAKELSSIKITSYDFSKELNKIKNAAVCKAEIFCEDKSIGESYLLFAPEKKLTLPKVTFTTKAKINNNVGHINIKADNYARYVSITHPDYDITFSDNYFDLLSGETKKITFEVPDNFGEDFLNKLEIRCANEIPPKCSKFSDFLFRKKVLLSPINLAQWIAYHFN